MANSLVGNAHYVDTAATLKTTRVSVKAFILTATAASGLAVIGDQSSNKMFDIREVTSGETFVLDFGESAINFPNGLKVITLTNAILTIVYDVQ